MQGKVGWLAGKWPGALQRGCGPFRGPHTLLCAIQPESSSCIIKVMVNSKGLE